MKVCTLIAHRVCQEVKCLQARLSFLIHEALQVKGAAQDLHLAASAGGSALSTSARPPTLDHGATCRQSISARGRADRCNSLACKILLHCVCLMQVWCIGSNESQIAHLCCHKDYLQNKKAPGEASKARQLAESETSTAAVKIFREVIEIACVCTVQDMLVIVVAPLVELTCKLCW